MAAGTGESFGNLLTKVYVFYTIANMHSLIGKPINKHLAALRAYWKDHKAFPTMAKLTDVLGLSSTGGVFKVIVRLVDAGYLERVGGRLAPTSQFFELPVLGAVRAEDLRPFKLTAVFDSMNIDDFMVDHPERSKYCRINDDSMRDAGLFAGDMVVVEANSPTKPGDIVVAVVNKAVTVKYLRADPAGGWFLESANPAYGVAPVSSSLEVLGVVIGSFRRFDKR